VTGEEDDNVTITLNESLAYHPRNTPVLLMAKADLTGSQTISNGADLPYEAMGKAKVFPLRNGPIMIGSAGDIVTYQFNNRDEHRLVGLSNPLDSTWSMTVNDDDGIVLLPAVRLHSIGRAGAEDLRVEREIVYHAPLSTTDEVTQRRRFTERFDNQDQWSSVSGTHAITEIDGNNALAVTGTDADKSSLTQLDLPTGANIDFGRAGRGTGGYLSYDAQVKVGFNPNPTTPPS
jgi:hypothetical protein